MKSYFVTLDVRKCQSALSLRLKHKLMMDFDRCTISTEQLARIPQFIDDLMTELLAAHPKWRPLHISTRGFIPCSVPGVPREVKEELPQVEILIVDPNADNVFPLLLRLVASQVRHDLTLEGGAR